MPERTRAHRNRLRRHLPVVIAAAMLAAGISVTPVTAQAAAPAAQATAQFGGWHQVVKPNAQGHPGLWQGYCYQLSNEYDALGNLILGRVSVFASADHTDFMGDGEPLGQINLAGLSVDNEYNHTLRVNSLKFFDGTGGAASDGQADVSFVLLAPNANANANKTYNWFPPLTTSPPGEAVAIKNGNGSKLANWVQHYEAFNGENYWYPQVNQYDQPYIKMSYTVQGLSANCYVPRLGDETAPYPAYGS